jgi:GNAT superfamily N-acetyltransferase
VIVRCADVIDIPELLIMAEEFIEESHWDVTFDAQRSKYVLETYIRGLELEVIIARENDRLLGGIMLCESWEFQERPFGYFAKFYVRPEGRNFKVGRALMRAAIEWFAERDCSHMFISATAGLNERDQRAFTILMKRAGMLEAGPIMWAKL